MHPPQCPHVESGPNISHAVAIQQVAGAPGTQTRPRDNQRSKVYRADTTSVSSTGSELLGSVAAVQAVVDQVLATDWWKERAPHRTRVRVADGRGRRTACSIGSEIRVPRRYRTMISVLHELAHEWMWCPLLEGHGPEFTGAFVALVREFMGDVEAEQLAGSFMANRVRVIESA